MRQMPFSISETSLDLFFDPESRVLEAYQLWTDPQSDVRIQQTWCDVKIIWKKARVGQPVARLIRRIPAGGIETLGHDHIRIFCATTARSRLDWVVNGQRRRVRSTLEGKALTFPLRSPRIRQMAFEIVPEQEGDGGVSLVWTALVQSDRDVERLKPRGKYGADWTGLIVEHPAVVSQPEYGLLFGREEVARLRRKAGLPFYRGWMDQLRQKARAMLKVAPEALIGRFACPPLHYTREFERKALAGTGAYGQSWDNFHHLALVGLIDQDVRVLRHAARWLLSVAHCEYWYNDFEGEIPGVTWHHRAFTESEVSLQAALTLDWAGGLLTPAGRNLVLDALSRRGLTRIQHDFIDPQMQYIRSCNQGLWFNAGRILGMIVLSRAWPRSSIRLKEVVADTREMFDQIYARDGGSVEGPAYWRVTTSYGLLGLTALARHLKCDPADLVPAKIRNLPHYPPVVMSQARPGCSLPIGDSRGDEVCPFSVAAMIDRLFPTAASARLVGYMSGVVPSKPKGRELHFEGLSDPGWSLIFGPDRLKVQSAIIPECATLSESGHTVLCRPLPRGGPVRLEILGAPRHHASHSHQDRGSILLEVAEERILVDRGIGHYSNPLGDLAKTAVAHNLLVPEDDRGAPLSQILWTEHPVKPRLSYRRGRFQAVLRLNEVWDSRWVRSAWRRLDSPRPGEFELTDDMEIRRAAGATLHFHTPCRIERQGLGFLLIGQRVRVLIEPRWTPLQAAWAVDDFGIGAYGQAYTHLQIQAAPARHHRLITRIAILS